MVEVVEVIKPVVVSVRPKDNTHRKNGKSVWNGIVNTAPVLGTRLEVSPE